MLNLPVHGPAGPDPLIRSFERHLYAENYSARTVTPTSLRCGRPTSSYGPRYLPGCRQPGRPRGVHGRPAGPADASTAATYHKVLKILYGWLAKEEAIPTNPILSAVSSPARVNILALRENLNLGSPASNAGALSPELQGQAAGAGGDGGGVEPAPSKLPASRCRLSYVPRGWCGAETRVEPAQPVATVFQTAPSPMGVSAWVEPGRPRWI
jgi:hypothetical protein